MIQLPEIYRNSAHCIRLTLHPRSSYHYNNKREKLRLRLFFVYRRWLSSHFDLGLLMTQFSFCVYYPLDPCD